VAPEHFEAPTAVETNEVIRKNGFLHRRGGFGSDRLDSIFPNRGERLIYSTDECG
jgi:hypothetical protein